SEHESRGDPSLPPGSAVKFREVFALVLVNRKALLEHGRFLQKVFGRTFRHTELLSKGPEKKVLAGGLDAIDDSSLARLILNPVALLALFKAIDEKMPSA